MSHYLRRISYMTLEEPGDTEEHKLPTLWDDEPGIAYDGKYLPVGVEMLIGGDGEDDDIILAVNISSDDSHVAYCRENAGREEVSYEG